MSACTFLAAAQEAKRTKRLQRRQLQQDFSSADDDIEAHEQQPLIIDDEDDDDDAAIQEDIQIVTSSLTHINDLLRSTLDIHKAANNQLNLNYSMTDLRQDVLEPVQTLLQRRNNPFHLQVECEPKNICIVVDGMRLKQCLLNLANNSKKFTHHGFIRIRAEVVVLSEPHQRNRVADVRLSS